MMMLNIFANLLFALFYLYYPLYKQVYAIAKALREYSLNKRAAIGYNTKTIILWILLLKAWSFTQCKMVGTQGFIGNFTNMVKELTTKNCENISHIELPT